MTHQYTSDDDYEDCGEGPWDTEAEAMAFAQAEVGLPWKVRGVYGKWHVVVLRESHHGEDE